MNKKILIVDDDIDILEVVQIILEDHGYIVSALSKGEKVDELVKSFNPDLILLDIWLSGIDGQDIAKRLKSNDSTKHIPIVMVSAVSKSDKIAEKAGVEDFLAKPFDMHDLIRVVAQHIR